MNSEQAESLIPEIFLTLHRAYGFQGWWPLLSRASEKGFDERGYRQETSLSFLKPEDSFVVFLGAVLTQRSTWHNAEQALFKLLQKGIKEPGCLAEQNRETLENLIRPAGFYRQKADRLVYLEKELLRCKYFDLSQASMTREDFLALKGLGPETADVLRVYGRLETDFVSDAYTSRIFSRLFGSAVYKKYDACRNLVRKAFELEDTPQTNGVKAVPCEAEAQNKLSPMKGAAFMTRRFASRSEELREFHALLVELAKRSCRVKPACTACVLKKFCQYAQGTLSSGQ